jgi:hypothetical protein
MSEFDAIFCLVQSRNTIHPTTEILFQLVNSIVEHCGVWRQDKNALATTSSGGFFGQIAAH